MSDELYMRRCFDLARLGAGQVSPNPMVGAVLVHEGRIIGEGWHRRWGEAHAEVNCLQSVRSEDRALLPFSTLYCNLEPCSHYGKTPPCAELIVREGIRRVVVANTDPNPVVAGRGLALLRDAGILVTENVLSAEGAWLNRAFFTNMLKKRPFVVLKWAQSRDGYLGKTGERTAISGLLAARLTHRRRAECDAVLVGATTALIDNPRLDTRLFSGKNPLRVTFDLRRKLPLSHHLLDDTIETWIYGPAPEKTFERTRFIPAALAAPLQTLLHDLFQANRGILLVEGGANMLQQFITAGLWDEILLIENRRPLHGGVAAPAVPPHAKMIAEFPLAEDRVRIFAPGS